MLKGLYRQFRIRKSDMVALALVNPSGVRYLKMINYPIRLQQAFTVLKHLMLNPFKFAVCIINIDSKMAKYIENFALPHSSFLVFAIGRLFLS
jgi:hypothetical protein